MLSSDASAPDNTMFETLLLGWESVGCGVKEGIVDGTKLGAGASDDLLVYDFLNTTSCIYNYDGGLTTPDCNEIVEWNLADVPIVLSVSQMNRLLALINDCPQSVSFEGSTSRPIQPLAGREINKICPASSHRNLRTNTQKND